MFDDNNKNLIYQFQEYNENRYILLEVGVMENLTDLIINEFKFEQAQFVILSCLYNKLELARLNEKCKIPIFKIKNSDSSIVITYNFHTFEHIQNKYNLADMTSTFKTKILLDGFFSYEIHNHNQIIVLNKSKEFNGKKAITKMLEYLKDYKQKNIILD